jgi:hypothetical protein
MEIEGKVFQIMPVQNISGQKGPIKKMEFVIEVETKFPKKVCFSLWNDKIDNFTAKEGDRIKVSFDLESRSYNNRWYTEAKAWKVESLQTSATDEIPDHPANKVEDTPSTFTADKEELDDLPF